MENNNKLIPMEFESSNGILLVNEDGTINKDSELSEWLLEIQKVDIEELDNYYKIQGLELCDGGDVLDFGWWDKKGNYNQPEKSWRLETFHRQDMSEKKIKNIVKQSFDWINKNRT
jgi:hypothetical protein